MGRLPDAGCNRQGTETAMTPRQSTTADCRGCSGNYRKSPPDHRESKGAAATAAPLRRAVASAPRRIAMGTGSGGRVNRRGRKHVAGLQPLREGRLPCQGRSRASRRERLCGPGRGQGNSMFDFDSGQACIRGAGVGWKRDNEPGWQGGWRPGNRSHGPGAGPVACVRPAGRAAGRARRSGALSGRPRRVRGVSRGAGRRPCPGAGAAAPCDA